jgi:hypothetical protein
MDDLIEALGIFRKYGNPHSPFNCAHDQLWVNIDPGLVPAADKARLEELGFFVSLEDGLGFTSFRFGSC